MRASVEPPLRGVSMSNDRPVGDLFRDLAAETSLLVRQEITLATVELTQKASFVGRQMIYLLLGFLLGIVSLLVLLSALIVGIATKIELWQSALYIGMVVALIAIAFIGKALTALRALGTEPSRTIEGLKEDKQWIKEQLG